MGKKYSTITLPIELKNKLEYLSSKRGGVAVWRVIMEAITFYELIEQKPMKKKELPLLDKCSWYVYKFGKSVALFLENPVDSNLSKLVNRIAELRERLKISEDNLALLEKLIVKYRESSTTDLKIEINDLVKLIISDIIIKSLFES